MDFLIPDEDEMDDDIEIIEFIPPPLPAEDNVDEPPQPDPLLIGPVFELPARINRRMRLDEIVIYELAIQNYREDIMRGLDEFSVRRLQEIVDRTRRAYAGNRRGEEWMELRERVLERERHGRQMQYIRLMELTRQAFREGSAPKKMPESPNLYTPKDGKFHWRIWDDAHVMDWVKQFISNEEHLTAIEYRQFHGPTLAKFLESDTAWKSAKWPFGLYIRVKSHFHRVVNERNGHKYEIN